METNLKQQWIKAYETTMEEYANGDHRAQTNTCAKCKLGYDEHNCITCPEMVFQIGDDYGCLHRANPAQMICGRDIDSRKQRKLVEYHKQAIELLKKISPKKFLPENFQTKTFERLKKIDQQIANNEEL